MNDVLWTLSVPATAIIRGPHFEVLPKRQCKISFSVKGDGGEEKWLSLLFDGVEAYKCTYLAALGSINRDLRAEAYGKMLALEKSRWLDEINQSYEAYHKAMPKIPARLQHLAICFDDGPF